MIHSAHQFDTSIEAFLRMDQLLEGCAELSRRVLRVSSVARLRGLQLQGRPAAPLPDTDEGRRPRLHRRPADPRRGDDSAEAFHGALLPTLSAKSIRRQPAGLVHRLGRRPDDPRGRHRVRTRPRARPRAIKRSPTSSGPSTRRTRTTSTTPRGRPQAVGAGESRARHPDLRRAHRDGARRAQRAHVRGRAARRRRLARHDRHRGLPDRPRRLPRAHRPKSKLLDPVALAFDVSPDRSSSSISAAGRRADSLFHGEVIERHRGTGWVVARLIELNAKHSPIAILYDGAGPANTLAPELEAAGIDGHAGLAKEHASACG
jgi:hypothetical protein